MKILHYSVFKNIPVGVRNQLLDEERAVARFGGDLRWDIAVSCMGNWDVPFRTPVRPGKGYGLLADVGFYSDAYRWLKRVAPDYDRVLVRYRTANPWQAVAFRKLENLYTIHHAVEENESGSGKGLKSGIERLIEKTVGPYSLRSVRGVIALTPEILSYESGRVLSNVPGFVYPNGIYLGDVEVVPDRREGALKLLFVGSLDAPWHGLDVAVKGLLSADPEMEIHVAGPKADIPGRYLNNVVFHGELTRTELAKVAQTCDAGLGTFALERKGMSQACTLKVREYLAIGLPVVSGSIDSGLPAGFPYYIIKTDAGDWNQVAGELWQLRKITRSEVRNAASTHIDKELMVGRLLEAIESAGN